MNDLDLEIPDFLKRDPKEQSAPVRTPVRRRRRVNGLVQVHLGDEIPRLGSGIRFVRPVKLGRKWVVIADQQGRKFRIAKRLWDELKPVGTEQ